VARDRTAPVGLGMVTDDALFSADWYRVSELVLRLRPTVRIGRQRLRGALWYVYRDEATGRQLRLNLIAHRFAGRLDGRMSVQVLWDQVLGEAGDEAPSQDEMVTLVQQLADAGMVSAEHGMDLARLSRREAERRRRRLLSTVNPLSFKVPLFDPGPFLERTWRWVSPLYTPWALVLYAVVALLGGLAAIEHWDSLRIYASDHFATPAFGLALWLVYPPLKAVHEFAHAWAVRVWGGRVPEMGVTLLMGIPVPYVDASGAALFASRGRRVAVSLAGILAELMIACGALWVWLSVEDGWLRTAAFAVMLVGAVSTVFVNGNPLVRFDAYFALSDALDAPNLAERARQSWTVLARRTIGGERDAPLPPGPGRDLPGLLAWGLMSWVYRVVVFAWLAVWLAPYSRPAALAVLAWGLWLTMGRAAWGTLRYGWEARWRGERPLRTIVGVSTAAAAAALVLAAVPLPDVTTLPGVVMPADAAKVRSAEHGRVAQVLVDPGQPVAAGTPLLRLENDSLTAEHARLRALRDGHEAERIRQLETDRAASGVALDDLERTRTRLLELERRLAALDVVAQVDGMVAYVDADGPLQRQVRQGDVLLYVLTPGAMRIQTLARDDQARRLQAAAGAPQARLGDQPGRLLPVRFAGQTPQAVRALPGPALGDRAGGPIATDPADRDGLRTLEPWFQLEFVPDADLPRIGASAEVRVSHPPRPAASQLADTLRRLFLRRLEG